MYSSKRYAVRLTLKKIKLKTVNSEVSRLFFKLPKVLNMYGTFTILFLIAEIIK